MYLSQPAPSGQTEFGDPDLVIAAQCLARLCGESDAPLGVAVSGGGDSVALLAGLAAWGRRRLKVYFVDHGLNADSAFWGRQVAQLSHQFGTKFEYLSVTQSYGKGSLQAQARFFRHRLLAEAAHRDAIKVIALGHTADDIAEGDWMRQNGAHLGHLRPFAPSPVWPEGRGVFLFRPLLSLRRDALRRTLQSKAISWIEDPANANPMFLRTRARQHHAEVKAADPSDSVPVDQGFAPSDRDLMAQLCQGGTGPQRYGQDQDMMPLLNLSPSALRRFLAVSMVVQGGREHPPRAKQLDRLVEAVRAGRDGLYSLSGARLRLDKGQFSIMRAPHDPRRDAPPRQIFKEGAVGVYDGRIDVTALRDCQIAPLKFLDKDEKKDILPEDMNRLKTLQPALRSGWPMALGFVNGNSIAAPLGLGTVANSLVISRDMCRLRWAGALGLIESEADLIRFL